MKKLLTSLVLFSVFLIGRCAYFTPNYADGERMESFEVELKDGQKLTSNDLKGNLTLIDFWGSWCGPCRQESPDLVQLHKDFFGRKFENAKGFDIFSVAIETDRQRWERAIQKDQLNWKMHYSSLDRFKDPLAKNFGIREIPSKFLVDQDGIIVQVNPTFEEIRTYLDARTAD